MIVRMRSGDAAWSLIDPEARVRIGEIQNDGTAFLAYDRAGRFLGAFSSLALAERRIETAPSI